MSVLNRPGIRWRDRAEDPELEGELLHELQRRRSERIAERQRRDQDRRSRRLFAVFVLIALSCAAVLGYAALTILRSLFG